MFKMKEVFRWLSLESQVKEPEYLPAFRDKVRVTKGFYRGLIGIVTGQCGNKYGINELSPLGSTSSITTVWVRADELESFSK